MKNREIIPSIAEVAIRLEGSEEKLFDYLMVQNTSQAMLEKLSKKRNQGYGGWHHPNSEICSNKKLIGMLKEHIEKGDMIDVMNFAGMIYIRDELYGEEPVQPKEKLYLDKATIEENNMCEWKYVEESFFDGYWRTSCGNDFSISNDNLPSENGFKFCPYCGKTLKEK